MPICKRCGVESPIPVNYRESAAPSIEPDPFKDTTRIQIPKPRKPLFSEDFISLFRGMAIIVKWITIVIAGFALFCFMIAKGFPAIGKFTWYHLFNVALNQDDAAPAGVATIAVPVILVMFLGFSMCVGEKR